MYPILKAVYGKRAFNYMFSYLQNQEADLFMNMKEVIMQLRFIGQLPLHFESPSYMAVLYVH